MDVFSHALWTNLLYYPEYKDKRKDRLMAVLFGVLPDLISFTPSTLFLIFSGSRFPMTMEAMSHMAVLRYAVYSYNYTHSLVVFTAVFLVVVAWRRGRIYWPLFGWLFHIVLDVFTHKAEFFATPIFFPISNLKYLHEFSWAEPHFLLANWIVLLLLYIALMYDYSQRRAFTHLRFLNRK
jgi:hypothetical protein